MPMLSWGNGHFALEMEWTSDSAPYVRRIRADAGELRPSAGVPLVQVTTVTDGHDLPSARLAHSALGASLRYRTHSVQESRNRSVLDMLLADPDRGLEATITLEAGAHAAAFRSRVRITNETDRLLSLTSVASWASHLGAPAHGDHDDWELHHAFSDWLGEGRWVTEPLDSIRFPGLHQNLTGHNPRGSLSSVSTGTWSSGSRSPMGVVSSTRRNLALGWQIEANAPWRWEVGEDTGDRYLAVGGPTDRDHQWLKKLAPGAAFETVGVILAIGHNFDGVVSELTAFRRSSTVRHTVDDERPIVFNDYMNTLIGDPTEDKLLPLIKAAATVGAEVFCIDAGWYDDGRDWWDSVGCWQPSAARFPHGLDALLGVISRAGMIPGLWLEPEVVGVRSSKAVELPDAAFLMRGGQRTVECGRYHLDLRHPAARAHLDDVVDRLVGYGTGYFKFDYNIDAGTGTDIASDSPGDGLLECARAYLEWIDDIHRRHPHVILENCASGAMRADAGTLSHFQLQSTSDQQSALAYPPIAVAAPASIPLEQAANWAYPQPEMTLEEIAFTLVTGLSGRLYLSGHLNRLDDEQTDLVSSAVSVARRIRGRLGAATPYWPLGMPEWDDNWTALGIDCGSCRYLAVWNRAPADATLHMPLRLGSKPLETIFPTSLPDWEVQSDTGTATFHNPTGVPSARLFRIDLDDVDPDAQ